MFLLNCLTQPSDSTNSGKRHILRKHLRLVSTYGFSGEVDFTQSPQAGPDIAMAPALGVSNGLT